MDNTKHLVLAILKFLDDQQRSPDLSPDAIESLEVATQCLESAYGLSVRDVELTQRYPLDASLPEIFSAGLSLTNVPEASPADRERAEKLKTDGNDRMKEEKYREAIECYTQAIELDRKNAVYFCNRAAAYSKAGDNRKSVDDCDRALALDPKYGKAFGRKGLAYSALGEHAKARECYQKALELDPVNDNYRENLRQAEISMSNRESSPMGGMGGGMAGLGGLNLGGMDLSSLLRDPALMSMATNMLSNPQMQSMMANIMSGSGGAGGTGGGVGPQGLNNLLQAGQMLAQQMQQQNPELVDQLRSQMRTQPDESGDAGPDKQDHSNNDGNNPST